MDEVVVRPFQPATVTDPLAAEARRLRVEEQLSVREIQARLGIGRARAYALLRGVPPPDWTRRPNAKDALRAEAVRLRADGRSVNEIAERRWCEGAKSKPWRPQDRLMFVNTDPGLLALFLDFLAECGVWRATGC